MNGLRTRSNLDTLNVFLYVTSGGRSWMLHLRIIEVGKLSPCNQVAYHDLLVAVCMCLDCLCVD